MIYGGNLFKPLSKEEVDLRVDNLTMWKYYIHGLKTPGKAFKSELREDNLPSCGIFWSRDKYLYKDFKTGEVLDIYNYIKYKYKCSFFECLKIINNDFGLNLGGTNDVPQAQILVKNSLSEEYSQESKDIFVKIRPFSLQDKEYWYNKYEIGSSLLAFYKVFPLEHYYVISDNEIKKIICDNPTYGYWHGENRWKIYSPYNDNYKWVSNLNSEDFSGYNQLDESGDILIITKSLKDVLIYKKLKINAISPQSETVIIKEDFINSLKARFKNIIINYDNDETGMVEASKLQKKFNLITFFTKNTKDISDFTEKYGFKATSLEISSELKELTYEINGRY